jgi:hypothetical protein
MYHGFSSLLSLSAAEGNFTRPADLRFDHEFTHADLPDPVPGPSSYLMIILLIMESPIFISLWKSIHQ